MSFLYLITEMNVLALMNVSPLQSDEAFQIFSTRLSLLIHSGMRVSTESSALMAESLLCQQEMVKDSKN